MSPGFRLSALLTCVLTALPMAAQHGGANRGAVRGPGFTGRSGRAPVTPVPRFGSGLPTYAPRNIHPISPSTAAALRRVPTLADPARFDHPDGRFDRRDGRFRNRFYPSFVPWILPWSIGWVPDALDYPDGPYPQPAPVAAYSADPVQAPAPAPARPAETQAVQPSYRQPYVQPAPPPPEPAEMEPVTLVFKDGRPNEQVRNYMITRSHLYIHDQRTRVIPLDEIDVEATQKANEEAGIDFQVPGRS